MICGRVLHPGAAVGEVLRLDAPLSFWGGLDPESGTIIDRAHPQVGCSMAGRVVVMPGSRGSAATPGVLAESLRRGTGPAGLIVTKADINLTAGAVLAEALYARISPVVVLDPEQYADAAQWGEISISVDGVVRDVSGGGPPVPFGGRNP